MFIRRLALALGLATTLLTPAVAPAGTDTRIGLEEALSAIKISTGVGATSDAGRAAWDRLANADPKELPLILAAMKGATPVGENWLRAAVDAVGEAADANTMPLPELVAFLADTSQSPRARRVAFEWIVRVEPARAEPLLKQMLNDPSIDLRYDAVAQLLAKAADLGEDDSAARLEIFQTALSASRDFGQLETISDELEKLGESVDLPGVLGFLKQWQVIGPFDNTGLAHFDTAYPPESEFDDAATYAGKLGDVEWKAAVASTDDGRVDLIKDLQKEKEAVGYAFATFVSDEQRSAQIRYQSKNATKVWLNGKLVASNEVYHSGGDFDQYIVTVDLQAGENALLIKLCQNEQKMPWEKEWDFRLRVVDQLGTPVGRQTPKVSQANNKALR